LGTSFVAAPPALCFEVCRTSRIRCKAGGADGFPDPFLNALAIWIEAQPRVWTELGSWCRSALIYQSCS